MNGKTARLVVNSEEIRSRSPKSKVRGSGLDNVNGHKDANVKVIIRDESDPRDCGTL